MRSPLYAVIVSGAAVSGTVDARKIEALRMLHVPAMTSADILMQGALDSTSASFARLVDTRALGSADLRFATGPGSRFISYPFADAIPPYLRVEAGVAQADTRTITLLTR